MFIMEDILKNIDNNINTECNILLLLENKYMKSKVRTYINVVHCANNLNSPESIARLKLLNQILQYCVTVEAIDDIIYLTSGTLNVSEVFFSQLNNINDKKLFKYVANIIIVYRSLSFRILYEGNSPTPYLAFLKVLDILGIALAVGGLEAVHELCETYLLCHERIKPLHFSYTSFSNYLFQMLMLPTVVSITHKLRQTEYECWDTENKLFEVDVDYYDRHPLTEYRFFPGNQLIDITPSYREFMLQYRTQLITMNLDDIAGLSSCFTRFNFNVQVVNRPYILRILMMLLSDISEASLYQLSDLRLSGFTKSVMKHLVKLGKYSNDFHRTTEQNMFIVKCSLNLLQKPLPLHLVELHSGALQLLYTAFDTFYDNIDPLDIELCVRFKGVILKTLLSSDHDCRVGVVELTKLIVSMIDTVHRTFHGMFTENVFDETFMMTVYNMLEFANSDNTKVATLGVLEALLPYEYFWSLFGDVDYILELVMKSYKPDSDEPVKHLCFKLPQLLFIRRKLGSKQLKSFHGFMLHIVKTTDNVWLISKIMEYWSAVTKKLLQFLYQTKRDDTEAILPEFTTYLESSKCLQTILSCFYSTDRDKFDCCVHMIQHIVIDICILTNWTEWFESLFRPPMVITEIKCAILDTSEVVKKTDQSYMETFSSYGDYVSLEAFMIIIFSYDTTTENASFLREQLTNLLK